jgi:hypothetical protein
MSKHNYEHSTIFASMKMVKERIGTNLTSLEYLETLDMFLWRAIGSIRTAMPGLVDEFMVKAIAQQTFKSSTKFSSILKEDKGKLPVMLFNALTERDGKSLEGFRNLRLNRGMLFGLVKIFLDRTAQYVELLHAEPLSLGDWKDRQLQLRAMERSLQVSDGVALFSVIEDVNIWYERARDWKSAIIEKYTRKAISQARVAYEDYNYAMDLSDVIQLHLVLLSRSINRCDSRLGVLTTFITSWFKSARSEMLRIINASQEVSYEEMLEGMGDAAEVEGSEDKTLYTRESVQHISMLAKQIDPTGVLRFHLGIPEFMPLDKRRILLAHALN